MPTYTSRSGLTKPAGAEFHRRTDFEANWDRIDQFAMGAFECTSTTRPTGVNRWNGLLIRETDTGVVRVWDGARWQNLSPVFAYKSATANQQIATVSGTWKSLQNLAAENYSGSRSEDFGAEYLTDRAADVILIRQTGIYEVMCRGTWGNVTGGPGGIKVIALNSANAMVKDGMAYNDKVLTGTAGSISGYESGIRLEAGWKLCLEVFQSTGSPQNYGMAPTGPAETKFGVVMQKLVA